MVMCGLRGNKTDRAHEGVTKTPNKGEKAVMRGFSLDKKAAGAKVLDRNVPSTPGIVGR